MKWKIFLLCIFFLSGYSKAFPHIYKCIDPETGEIFFTNYKKLSLNEKCKLIIKERKNSSIKIPYEEWFEKIGKSFSLDPALLKAIAKVESSFNPKAISPKGALGLMQLMPSTIKSLRIKNPFDPVENLKGGAMYFKQLLDEFKDLSLALAAYHAGPKKVKAYKGIPPFPETQNFVKNVLHYYSIFKNK